MTKSYGWALICLICAIPIAAKAGEKATYVGEARYSCSSDSVDCAVLKQRNSELSNQQRRQWEADQRYESDERREREYERARRKDYRHDNYLE